MRRLPIDYQIPEAEIWQNISAVAGYHEKMGIIDDLELAIFWGFFLQLKYIWALLSNSAMNENKKDR